MSDPAAIAEDRHGRILAELAGLSLALARDLQARAMAAETTEEAARLAMAFQRVSRGLRQTLALELKVIRYRDALAREAAQAEARAQAAAAAPRPSAPPAEPSGDKPVFRRSEAIAKDVESLIWDEAETPDWDEAVARRRQAALSDWLDAAVARPDFLENDLDDQVIAACRAAGVDPNRLYVLDDAPGDEPPDMETAPPCAGATPSPELQPDTG
ncbi:hypothetical protein [Phenylobacterium sp.]|uniref:hypothetical protein n=1 Tax=Phenylobacterium sp. TaxID=1871053 RepID=UPI0035B33E5D